MPLFRRKESTGKWWIDHSLLIVLTTLLVIWTAMSIWTGHMTWIEDDAPGQFWHWYLFEWSTSTLADLFGLVLIVFTSKYLFERNSDEDNDDAELKKKEGVDKEPETT